MQKELMNLQEVSEYLGWQKIRIQNLIRSQSFPATQIGDELFFNKPLVDRWIQDLMDRFKGQTIEKKELDRGRIRVNWVNQLKSEIENRKLQLEILREDGLRQVNFKISKLKGIEGEIPGQVNDDTEVKEVIRKCTSEREALEKERERIKKNIRDLEAGIEFRAVAYWYLTPQRS